MKNKYSNSWEIIKKQHRDGVECRATHVDKNGQVPVLESFGITKNYRNIEEAIDNAIKYDEKETPKKVIDNKKYGKSQDYYWICPSCKGCISKAPKSVLRAINDCSYCKKCGQKLDWSEDIETRNK